MDRTEYYKKYHSRHRDRRLFAAINRIHKKRFGQNSTDITKEKWDAMIDSLKGICPRCNKKAIAFPGFSTFTMDHIFGLAQGGTHTLENVQPLCFSCNVAKGADCMRYLAVDIIPRTPIDTVDRGIIVSV